MKKQINPTIKAHLIRGAFYVLLMLAVSVIPFGLAQRNSGEQIVSSGAVGAPNQPRLLITGQYRVLVVSADCSNPETSLLASLLAEPGIVAADLFNATAGTPTLAQLQQYDIALVFSDCAYLDPTTLGNNLDAYISGGGIVVALNFDWFGGAQSIGGAWLTNDTPFNNPATTNFANGSLGTCTFAPLCDGVTTLNSHFREIPTLAAGATAAGTWSDGSLMMAYKGRTVGISGYFGDFADNYSGQLPRIVANAGRYFRPAEGVTFNNLIVNAGFETGSFSPWVIDGTNPTPLVTTAQAHSGTHSALLGTVSNPEPLGDGSFYQQITVPAAGGILSYWWLGGTTDTIVFDFQDAYVTNTSGTILATISHTCKNTGGWVQQTFDMTPYAGQTVRIKFLVHEDGFGDPTWMYVDDLELIQPNANYVLYNSSTRQTAVWRLNNNVFTGSVFGPTPPAGWSLVAAADFNGSLNPDYLLFNASTRQSAIWYLSGTTFIASAFGPTVPSGWVLVTTADFNGDGPPDYVLYQPATHKTAIWYLNNNHFVSSAYGPTLPAGWSLVAALPSEP